MSDTSPYFPRCTEVRSVLTLERALQRSIKKQDKQSFHKVYREKNGTRPEHIVRPEHLIVGDLGEDLAADYLKNLGYEILHRNVFIARDEIDIIARDSDELVFAEVRTRTVGRLSPPESTVGRQKLQKLLRSAYAWVDAACYRGFWRIDLVAITITPEDEKKIEHIKTITEAIN